MNANPEYFIGIDPNDGTSKVNYPPPVLLMDGVLNRRTEEKTHIDILIDTSSGHYLNELIPTSVWFHSTEPDVKSFGHWLDEYRNKLEINKKDTFQSPVSKSMTQFLANRNLLVAHSTIKNKIAIDLLQSWIEEAPDDQNNQDFLNLKELIDEQRTEDRKLFE